MIDLRELLPEEIAPYFDDLWAAYRDELISAGFSAGYASESVENTKKSIFTDRELNPGNHIFYAYFGQDKVGKIWLTSITREDKVEWSIYDIETFDEFRGKGFGRAIMIAAEDYVRSQGGDSISLSVFGNNTVARNLYQSLDYEIIRLGLKKKLS